MGELRAGVGLVVAAGLMVAGCEPGGPLAPVGQDAGTDTAVPGAGMWRPRQVPRCAPGRRTADPAVLVARNDRHSIWGLAVDASGLYVGGIANAADIGEAAWLGRAPLQGGDIVQMWEEDGGGVVDLATSRDSVFIATYDSSYQSGRMLEIPKAGGAPVTFDVRSTWVYGPGALVTDAEGQPIWLTEYQSEIRHRTASGQIEVLTTLPSRNIAIRDDTVLFMASPGEIRAVPVGGGPSSLVWLDYYANRSSYNYRTWLRGFAIAPTEPWLFAREDARILAARLDGGPVRPLVTAPAGYVGQNDGVFSPMVVDDAFVYYGDNVRHELRRVPATGGQPVTIAAGVNQIYELTQDRDHLYWIGWANPYVVVYSALKCVDGDEATDPEPGAGPDAGVTVGADAGDGGAPADCERGTIIADVGDQQTFGGLAVADDQVYFVAAVNHAGLGGAVPAHATGTLRRAPAAGGDVTELWQGAELPRAIATGDGFVYMLTDGYGDPSLYPPLPTGDGAVHWIGAHPPFTDRVLARWDRFDSLTTLVTDGRSAFWARPARAGFPSGPGMLSRTDPDGRTTVLADDLLRSGSSAAYSPDGTVYVASWGAGTFAVPLDGGPVTTVASGILVTVTGTTPVFGTGGYDLAADGASVYLADWQTNQIVKSTADGPKQVVACGGVPVFIGLDDRFVYWADAGDMTVRRAPR